MRGASGWWLALGLVLVSCAAEQPGGGTGADAGATLDAAPPSVDAAPIRLPDTGPRRLPDAAARHGLGPPYPIVLAHGFFGFQDFAGVDFITYFYGVKDDLAARGETLVFTPAVDPFNSSEYRGEQLLAHVQDILDQTGYEKVNLIGHSQGGLDARYVAHQRPDLIASVTTYATPNRGSPVADVVLGLVSDGRAQALIDQIVRVIGAPLWDAAGNETSVFTALRQFSSDGIAPFNDSYPDADSVTYYSVAGRTQGRDGYPDCQVGGSPEFIRQYTYTNDPVDPLLSVPAAILAGSQNNIPNDGLVRVRDARWGLFLGCIPGDHLDEIGQLLGDSPGLGNDFDYKQFFADLVAYLRAQGF